jgi:hypothetical protein
METPCILFALTRPDGEQADKEQWSAATIELEGIARANKEIEPLGRGAWLIRGSSGLSLLANGIRGAIRNEIAFRVLIIQDATDWSPVLKSD